MKAKISFILLVLGVLMSYGQISILVETSTREPKLNDRFTLTVILEANGDDIEQQSPIKLPDLSKFHVLGTATEQVSGVNPRTRSVINQIFYQVILQPKQKGKVKIGSAAIQVNDKVYKTEPFEIMVKADNRTVENDYHLAEIYLSLEIANKEIFQHEPTVAVIRAYSRSVEDLRKIKTTRFPKDRDFDIYTDSSKKGEIEYDANILSQIVAEYVIIPQRSGIIVLPQASVTLSSKQSPVSSNKMKIFVKPLPKNQPKSFKNAVGNFKVEITKLDKKNEVVEVNKPVNIQVKVLGKGNLKNLQIPKIIPSEKYTVYKPQLVSNYTLKNDNLVGFVAYNYVVVAKMKGDVSLDLEPFSFFNPETNTYVNVKYNPLVISAVSTEKLTKNQPEEKILDKITGLLDSENTLDNVKENPKTSVEKSSSFFSDINLFLLIGGMLCVGVFLFFLQKKKEPKTNITKTKLTNIAEEEERIKKNLSLDIDASFNYLENLKNEKKYTEFLNFIQEFYKELEIWSKEKHEKDLTTYLTDSFGDFYSDGFFELQQELKQETYAPIHDDNRIEELFERFGKLYHEIIK